MATDLITLRLPQGDSLELEMSFPQADLTAWTFIVPVIRTENSLTAPATTATFSAVDESQKASGLIAMEVAGPVSLAIGIYWFQVRAHLTADSTEIATFQEYKLMVVGSTT